MYWSRRSVFRELRRQEEGDHKLDISELKAEVGSRSMKMARWSEVKISSKGKIPDFWIEGRRS